MQVTAGLGRPAGPCRPTSTVAGSARGQLRVATHSAGRQTGRFAPCTVVTGPSWPRRNVDSSVRYPLARGRWSGAALIECAELTAGSTWQAAAGVQAINDDLNVIALQTYIFGLYRQCASARDQSVGMHTRRLQPATTPARWPWLETACTVYPTLGVAVRVTTTEKLVAESLILDSAGFRVSPTATATACRRAEARGPGDLRLRGQSGPAAATAVPYSGHAPDHGVGN